MIPLDCSKKRKLWELYDVGGKYYNSDYNFYVSSLKKDYANNKCGSNVLLEDCVYLEEKITNTLNEISALMKYQKLEQIEGKKSELEILKSNFKNKGCVKEIEKYMQSEMGQVIDVYSGLDKERITENTTYEKNKRIFIGASILILGVTIVLINKKK
jgi:hypothetical protein